MSRGASQYHPLRIEKEISDRAVMFEGTAEFVEPPEEKRRALEMMIDRFEPAPANMKAGLTPAALAKTTILRLRVVGMSGKQSPVPAGD